MLNANKISHAYKQAIATSLGHTTMPKRYCFPATSGLH